MKDIYKTRVAWLIPSMKPGYYLQPVLREFAAQFSETTVITGAWPGFVHGCEDKFQVKVVKAPGYIKFKKDAAAGYGGGFSVPSIDVIPHLFSFNPEVIFVTTFTLWTMISLAFKSIKKCKIIVIYSGSSPGADMQKIWLRRFMAPKIDAFITNSMAGKKYLTEVLKVEEKKVFAKPYQIPDSQALTSKIEDEELKIFKNIKHPVFITIGRITQRKGIPFLLEACSLLKKKGYEQFTAIIIGKRPLGMESENFSEAPELKDNIKWIEWVDYGKLGYYLQKADVFLFPTLEDIWGMVVLEAMLFGKPILCSQYAGALEMIVDGENGYIFDPYKPEKLAELMALFINQPELIKKMGEKSLELIEAHTPEAASKHLSEVVKFAINEA